MYEIRAHMKVRFKVLTAASVMEAVRTSETSVDNHFTRQYIPEHNSEHISKCFHTKAPLSIIM
jgi:hypothetical protein